MGADVAAQELVEVTGAGSTPLQPLPRTALTGVKDKPPITSTLSDVVAAIQAHPQASALLTATASSGSLGSTVMQAMSRTYLSGSTGRTSYQWTSQDRLAGVTMPDGTQHDYSYDYRARRVGMARHGGPEPARDTAVVFSGGLSVAEYEGVPGFAVSPEAPSVHYVRGPDMGGGVGGMLYSVRGSTVKYSLSNGRGDIIAQSDASATITWTASYEAYGKRPVETGENLDKQRANSKDEDPTGLLNEGFRYRDIETGMWLSRDPAGFVDGPNLYAYVKQNPWTSWDPHGLQGSDYNKRTQDKGKPDETKQFLSTVADAVPVIGTLKGIYEVGGGRDPITQKDLSTGERVVGGMATVAGLLPFGKTIVGRLGKAFAKRGDDAVEAVVKHADDIGGSSAKVTVGKAEGLADDATKAVEAPAEFAEGSFSITQHGWQGYPTGPKPAGPFRLLEGSEMKAARKAANNANRAIHRADPSLAGRDIHEIQPVKFGGSPTDPTNKIPLTRQEHNPFTTWWRQLQRDLKDR